MNKEHRAQCFIRSSLLLFTGLIIVALTQVNGQANSDTGSILGTVTYYGNTPGDHQTSVALFLNTGDESPIMSDDLPGRSIEYAFYGISGTFYVSAYFDADESGGPPGPGESLAWYDANGDGLADPVVVGSGATSGIDIALGDIIYVDAAAGAGANDGSCWNDAYDDLQTALGASSPGDEIWIAAATYKPTSSTNRSATFQLKSGVGLYGGFAGDELLRSQRDWNAYPTILSGDIGTAGVATDNSYNVVTGSGVDSSGRIDGLVITAGYANGSGIQDKGGGLQITGGSPVVANVSFIKNFAANHGAGMSTQSAGSAPLVINSTFSGNSTDFNGAMANLLNANTTVINSTFTGNTGGNAGGIVNLEQGASTMRNVILWGNGANEILLHNGGTIDIQYSIVAGDDVYTGAGNDNADPRFVDADGPDNAFGTLDDDLTLQAGSPAIDTGTNAPVPEDVTDTDGDGNLVEILPWDMARNPRFMDGPAVDGGLGVAPIVDMGAFETASNVYLPLVIKS